jgi:hypothetical protein
MPSVRAFNMISVLLSPPVRGLEFRARIFIFSLL